MDAPADSHHAPRRDEHPGDGATRSTTRMEGFADAVFAIAFTLPVVELELPDESGPLVEQLVELGPSYLGFALASGVIGIYWVHHHFSGAIYRTTGHWMNVMTVLFLASIAFIAFPARVLAEHVHDPEGFGPAAVFFLVALAATSLAWCVKWTIGRAMGDVDDRLDPAYVVRLNRMYFYTTLLNIAAVVIAWFVPLAGLALAGLVLAYYVLPPHTPIYRVRSPIVEGEGLET